MSNLTRWDPFQEMLTLREAMNQLLENSVISPSAAGGTWMPAIDISETPDAYLIEAAVPGLKPEDLDITFENGVLTVSGEVHQEREQHDRTFHRRERRYGRFQRSVSLPARLQYDAVKATLVNGVLHIEVPKSEDVKPRKINIQVES